jgi:hypothetical protein
MLREMAGEVELELVGDDGAVAYHIVEAWHHVPLDQKTQADGPLCRRRL